MNFKPELCPLVLSGAKTVTRRPVNGRPCRYKVGRDYAVCPGRGRRQVGRMIVCDVRQETVGAITDAEAVLEGFADRKGFVAYWTRLYAGAFDPDMPVWRIEFEAIPQ